MTVNRIFVTCLFQLACIIRNKISADCSSQDGRAVTILLITVHMFENSTVAVHSDLVGVKAFI